MGFGVKMSNQLLILEASESLIRTKFQLSDFLTFRSGWWCPQILFIDSKGYCLPNASDLGIWINGRAKKARINIVDSVERPAASAINQLVVSEKSDSIICIQPDYSPAVLLDEFWINLGDSLNKQNEVCVRLNGPSSQNPEPIGFAIHKNLMLKQPPGSLRSLKSHFLTTYRPVMPIAAVPNLFHEIKEDE